MTMGQGLRTLMIAIGLLLGARFARVMRGEASALKTRDFIALAQVRGRSHWRIMTAYILPNVMNTFMVLLTLHVGVVILAEASLSFPGGRNPLSNAVLGTDYLKRARQNHQCLVGVPAIPGLAITLVVLGV